MRLAPGIPLEWVAQETDIVVVDVDVDKYIDVYVDKLERKVGELERNLGEFNLTQSSETGLITTQDHMVGLV